MPTVTLQPTGLKKADILAMIWEMKAKNILMLCRKYVQEDAVDSAEHDRKVSSDNPITPHETKIRIV